MSRGNAQIETRERRGVDKDTSGRKNSCSKGGRRRQTQLMKGSGHSRGFSESKGQGQGATSASWLLSCRAEAAQDKKGEEAVELVDRWEGQRTDPRGLPGEGMVRKEKKKGQKTH